MNNQVIELSHTRIEQLSKVSLTNYHTWLICICRRGHGSNLIHSAGRVADRTGYSFWHGELSQWRL